MSRSTEGAKGTENAASESIIATEIVAKEHHRLFIQLKTSVRKFLGNLIDQLTTLGLIEKAFGHSRTTDAGARWVVDTIILKAYAKLRFPERERNFDEMLTSSLTQCEGMQMW
ncbi:hypothetical protein PENFLA_c004G01854 [Penicillium flavigenum]|uniref:Uncharacterized protein n=1 Tax=Penicillium flavigenum TaxID=254877 RepID=A0A1V6TRE2_9EURO|nr:hypothetical protein PENFLA_c004G01854 [Penicillium flavigenum]